MEGDAKAAAADAWREWGGELWPNLTPWRRCLALRSWLDNAFRFKPDPPGVELVRHPREMLQELARRGYAEGDCDDAAALAAAVALACGLRVRWKVLAFQRGAPYAHVYAEVSPREGGKWCELDVTRPAALPGLTPAVARFAVVEWS